MSLYFYFVKKKNIMDEPREVTYFFPREPKAKRKPKEETNMESAKPDARFVYVILRDLNPVAIHFNQREAEAFIEKQAEDEDDFALVKISTGKYYKEGFADSALQVVPPVNERKRLVEEEKKDVDPDADKEPESSCKKVKQKPVASCEYPFNMVKEIVGTGEGLGSFSDEMSYKVELYKDEAEFPSWRLHYIWYIISDWNPSTGVYAQDKLDLYKQIMRMGLEKKCLIKRIVVKNDEIPTILVICNMPVVMHAI